MKNKVNKNVDKFNIKIWILLVLIIVSTMMINIEGIYAFFTNKTITLKSSFQLSYHTLKYSYYEVSGNGVATSILQEKTSVMFTGTQINVSKDSKDIMPEDIPKDKNYNKIVAKIDENEIVLLGEQAQENYTFNMPDNDCEIKIYYYLNTATYTVHFDSNGGTGNMDDQVFNVGESKKLSSNKFSRTGYTFTGWKYNGTTYSNEQLVSDLTTTNNGKVTLTAQWSENSYTVYFYPNGGSGSYKTQSFRYTESKALYSNSFTKSHATFKNWNTKSNGSGTSYSNGQYVSQLTAENNGTVDLYAQWNSVGYFTYKFYNNYSSSDNDYTSQSYYDDEYVYFPTRSRTGYNFLGWSRYRTGGSVEYAGNSSAKGSSVTATSWYAQWSENLYSVYDSNNKLVAEYTNLKEALSNASSGSTIKPKKSTNEVVDATVGKNLTLDLNGYTITFSSSKITNNSTLTIKGNGTLTTSSSVNLINNNGTLNLQHTGTISNTNTGSYYTITGSGGVNMTGTGTVSANGSGAAIKCTGASKDVIVKDGKVKNTGTNAIEITGSDTEIYIGVSEGTSKTTPEITGRLYGSNSGVGEIRVYCGKVTGTKAGAIYSKGKMIRINHGKISIGSNPTESNKYTVSADNDNTQIVITGGEVTNDKTNAVVSTSPGIVKVYGDPTITSTATTTTSSYAISNEGTTEINGTPIITGHRCGVYVGKGTATITGGTIDAPYWNDGVGVWVTSGGTLTLGEDNNSVNTSVPNISGGAFGITIGETLNFYDGRIEGRSEGAASAIHVSTSVASPNSVVIKTPSGYTYTTTKSTTEDRETTILTRSK